MDKYMRESLDFMQRLKSYVQLSRVNVIYRTAIAVFQSIKAKKFLGLFQQHLVSLLCIFPYRTDRSTRRTTKMTSAMQATSNSSTITASFTNQTL
jgi:hypothetical protein